MFKLICLVLLLNSSVSAAAIEVAITVDDLPAHGALPPDVSRIDIAKKMLGVFKKHKVIEAYGFINAGKTEFQKADEAVYKLWTEAGYPLANHAWSHMDLHQNTASDFTKDILRNEAPLKALNGKFDWHYFRYPYLREGEEITKRNTVRAFLAEHKYKIAPVTIDFGDWSWNAPYARCSAKKDQAGIDSLRASYLKTAGLALEQSENIFKYLYKRNVKHILLLHIGAFDAEMMDELLSLYKKKGVKFISLKKALTDDVYKIDPAVAEKWGSELQFQILKSKNLSLKQIGVEGFKHPGDELAKICL